MIRYSSSQANEQLEGLTERMRETHEPRAKELILVEALMIVAHLMPDNPRTYIARILTAYDEA